MISLLKRTIRKHNGFAYPRFWLWLEEFIYHMNNSGSDVHADFRTLLDAIGQYGMRKIEDAPHHSVYYDYTMDWHRFCTNPQHIEMKDCDCSILDEEDEHEGSTEEEEPED